jgi:membrane-bound serine protease (ClpP class)
LSGALAVGGLVAFVIGATILIDTEALGDGVSLPLVLTIAGASAVFILVVVGMAVKARRQPVVSGAEELAGDRGEVLADFTGEGWATIHGETWRVRSAVPLAQGQPVLVTRIEGLTLDVEPLTLERNT